MNMQVAIPCPTDAPAWSLVEAEVHAWRGACMQAFARAEAAVTETLLFLSTVDSRGEKVGLRHLTGQKLDDLARAIGSDGAFAGEGRKAQRKLEDFRIHEGLRTHLAHDVGCIAIKRDGNWVVVFRQLAIRGRIAERITVAFEQPDAAALLTDLRQKAHTLDQVLGNMRKSIELARSM